MFSLFGGKVRIRSNPDRAMHPTIRRPLRKGDVVRYSETMNGNIYWTTSYDAPIQSIPTSCVKQIGVAQ